jgi:hypothetical protein
VNIEARPKLTRGRGNSIFVAEDRPPPGRRGFGKGEGTFTIPVSGEADQDFLSTPFASFAPSLGT